MSRDAFEQAHQSNITESFESGKPTSPQPDHKEEFAMKRVYIRPTVILASVLGLILLAPGGWGTSHAASLSASDLPDGMALVTWQLESMQTSPPAVVRPMEQGIIV